MDKGAERVLEITAMEQNKEKRLKRKEDSVRNLWDNVNHSTLHYRDTRRKREKGPEKIILTEIIAENSPNMGKEAVTQVQEAQRVPYSINPRRNMLGHSNQTDKN